MTLTSELVNLVVQENCMFLSCVRAIGYVFFKTLQHHNYSFFDSRVRIVLPTMYCLITSIKFINKNRLEHCPI